MRVVDAGCDEPVLVEPSERGELHEPDDRESAGAGWLRGLAERPVLLAPTPGW